MATCKGCGAAILFLRTPGDQLMPVDAALTTIVQQLRELVAGEAACSAPILGHVPHHITCPKVALLPRWASSPGARREAEK